VEFYLTAADPGFQSTLKVLMNRTNAAAQGNTFEQYMMATSDPDLGDIP
jgi:hypothetical protein